jgi:hypothetical protein
MLVFFRLAWLCVSSSGKVRALLTNLDARVFPVVVFGLLEPLSRCLPSGPGWFLSAENQLACKCRKRIGL